MGCAAPGRGGVTPPSPGYQGTLNRGIHPYFGGIVAKPLVPFSKPPPPRNFHPVSPVVTTPTSTPVRISHAPLAFDH